MEGDITVSTKVSDNLREPAVTLLRLLELMEAENDLENVKEILALMKKANDELREAVELISDSLS